MSEAKIIEILGGPDYFTCKTYNTRWAKVNCVARQRNADGWEKTKGSKTGAGRYFTKAGAGDPNCLDCKQGRQIKNELEKPKEENPMEGFEKYTNKWRRSFNKPPTMSSQGISRLFFSKSAIQFTNADQFPSVYLFYDSNKKQIGIQFHHTDDADSLKVTNRGNKSPAIAIRGFMQNFKLQPFKRILLVKSDLAENFYMAKLS